MDLDIARLSINGASSLTREMEIQPENKGRTTWSMDLAPYSALKSVNTGKLEFVSGKGKLYVQSISVQTYELNDLESLNKHYLALQKKSYESSVRFINSMEGTKTIIQMIKKELQDHQLRVNIAKTTGDTIMIAGAVGAFFSFGISAIVAGAVGGSIAIGTDIADWVTTNAKGHEIQRAVASLKEYQYDFQESFTAFQQFCNSASKTMGVDVSLFMAVMNNVKRLGLDVYKAYTTFRGFEATYAMFQSFKTGQSIESIGIRFTNAADMTMMVNRVGMNLGKEVGTMTKVGVWFGETTAKVSTFLGAIAPLLNIADIIVTWMSTNPQIKEADAQIANIDKILPMVKDYRDTINPANNDKKRRMVKFEANGRNKK